MIALSLFSGLNCGKVANICESDPCMNQGVCVQEGSTYYCNCTAGHHGLHCEDIILPAITSNSAGISSEELYAILGNYKHHFTDSSVALYI